MASGLENVREHTDEIASKQNAWFGAHVFHRTRSCEIWEGKDIVEPQMVYNRALDVCVDVSFVDAAARRHNGRKGSGGRGWLYCFRRQLPPEGTSPGCHGGVEGAGPKKNLIFEEDTLNCGVAGIKGKEEKRNVFFSGSLGGSGRALWLCNVYSKLTEPPLKTGTTDQCKGMQGKGTDSKEEEER